MSMSPSRGEKDKKNIDRKRLKSEDPRKQSRVSSNKAPRYRIDGATLGLSIVALILLTVVVVLMIRRPGSAQIADPATLADGAGPVIERVESDTSLIEEPVPDLGIPEARVEPEDPIPADTGEDSGSGAVNDSTARLFFVKVSDEGKIGLKSVLRGVPSTGSPLTTAVQALMEGPRPGELSNDVLSLVPEDSRLIGARVEGGVAFLDFTEDFRFNALGIEGYKAQVEQIVYTATEFATVEKVQFLIEGQRIDFLGGEGFWVGGPLGRDDF